MNVLDRALPKLQAAHQAMWEVAEVCGDEFMAERLRDAMAANGEAQVRLQLIEREARDV